MRLTSLGLSALVLVACKSHQDDKPPPPKVPKATAPIKIDGEWNDPDWNNNSLQFKFRGLDGDDAERARPYSEVRFVHDDSNLYVALYASDVNIVSSDVFELAIGPLAVQINPAGKVTPESPDIKVGVDADGTIDDPSNHDEEWKLEISIPLAKTGLAAGKPVDAHTSRCDVMPDGKKRCGEWRGQLAL